MLFREIYRRLGRGLLLLLAVLVGGAVGYRWIGLSAGQDWAWWDCLYMTVITIASVGYTEVFPVREIPGAEGFTMAIILLGAGAMVYASSVLVALFVEEDLRHALRRERMRKAIKRMKGRAIRAVRGARYVRRGRRGAGRRYPGETGDSVVEGTRDKGKPQKNTPAVRPARDLALAEPSALCAERGTSGAGGAEAEGDTPAKPGIPW